MLFASAAFIPSYHPPRYLGTGREAESSTERVSIDQVTDQTPREAPAAVVSIDQVTDQTPREAPVEVIAVSDDDAPITTLNKAKTIGQPVDVDYIYKPVASHESSTPSFLTPSDDGASHSSLFDLSPRGKRARLSRGRFGQHVTLKRSDILKMAPMDVAIFAYGLLHVSRIAQGALREKAAQMGSVLLGCARGKPLPFDSACPVQSGNPFVFCSARHTRVCECL